MYVYIFFIYNICSLLNNNNNIEHNLIYNENFKANLDSGVHKVPITVLEILIKNSILPAGLMVFVCWDVYKGFF